MDTSCVHTPARCNGGGYDGCACRAYTPGETRNRRGGHTMAEPRRTTRRRSTAGTRRKRPATPDPRPPKAPSVKMVTFAVIDAGLLSDDLTGMVYKVSDDEFVVK